MLSGAYVCICACMWRLVSASDVPLFIFETGSLIGTRGFIGYVRKAGQWSPGVCLTPPKSALGFQIIVCGVFCDSWGWNSSPHACVVKPFTSWAISPALSFLEAVFDYLLTDMVHVFYILYCSCLVRIWVLWMIFKFTIPSELIWRFLPGNCSCLGTHDQRTVLFSRRRVSFSTPHSGGMCESAGGRRGHLSQPVQPD